MSSKYIITQDQLESIEHYKRMFELNAQSISELCSSEKHDIVYGFELGQMHSHLRECFMNMMNLESDIRDQEVIEKQEVFDPEQEAIIFTENKLSNINLLLLGEEYKVGFKEGVEKYIIYKHGKSE